MFFCFTYRYFSLFPEMINAIGKRISQNKAKASGVGSGDAEGHALVGFGPYSSMTRKGLILESVDQNHKSYVQELLHHPVTHPGGQLDKIKQYLIRRHQKQEKNDDALARFADEVEKRMGTGNK